VIDWHSAFPSASASRKCHPAWAEMTCTVVMKEGAAPEIGLGIKKVLAAIL
jgi:hypothetical protein